MPIKSGFEIRRPFLLEMHELGFTASDMAETLQVSTATVSKDLGRLRALNRLVSPSVPMKQRFAKQFRCYADMRIALNDNTHALTQGCDAFLFAKLQSLIREKEIIAYILGVLGTMHTLCTPRFSQSLVGGATTGYTRLLVDIYEIRYRKEPLNLDDAEKWWDDFLTACFEKTFEAPTDFKDLCERIRAEIVSESKDKIMPEWNEEVMKIVDEQLHALSARYAQILRAYYGIGEEAKTFQQIGQEMSSPITGGRIGEIVQNVLRKLREPKYTKKLSRFAYPYNEVYEEIMESEKREADFAKEMKERGIRIFEDQGFVPLHTLCVHVDEFEISVRTSNCLANGNVRYIGQLIQMTENEMLRIKNMGRKSVKELKELLAEYGFEFGTLLHPQIKEAFDKFIEQRKSQGNYW